MPSLVLLKRILKKSCVADAFLQKEPVVAGGTTADVWMPQLYSLTSEANQPSHDAQGLIFRTISLC